MVAKLTDAERAGLGGVIPAWEMVAGQDAIRRAFVFADFSAAFAFMARVALLADPRRLLEVLAEAREG